MRTKELNNQTINHFKKQHHGQKTNWRVDNKLNKRITNNTLEIYFQYG